MKFDKKKLLLFGLLPLLVVGIVSAGLVTYLSNQVKADITVESPMIAGISLGGWEETTCTHPDTGETVDRYPEGSHDLADWTTTETPLQISTHGGKTITLYTMSENVADVEIKGFEEAIVTNWAGVTCDDFESVIVRVDSIYGDLGYGTPKELISLGGCHVIDDWHIQFGSLDDSTWGAGETDVSEIVVTFDKYAEGDYTFSYRVV